MPPVRNDRIQSWINEYPGTFITDGILLYCRVCEKKVSCSKKFQVVQHVRTATHIVASVKKNKPSGSCGSQTVIPQIHGTKFSRQDIFCRDLAEALITSNIPLDKLNTPKFRTFLNKYCNEQTIPNELTLRQNYIVHIYKSVLDKIRCDIGDDLIWISINEATDSKARYILYLFMGKLSTQPSSGHLIASKALEKVDHSTVARFINDSIISLFNATSIAERICVFISDAAPYMIEAGEALKIFYPSLIHVSCFAKAVHRFTEEIRTQFKQVIKLISALNKLFTNAPSRIQYYREQLPSLPLPPEPANNRTSTWIETALFCNENFFKIKGFIDQLEVTSKASCVRDAKEAFEDSSLQQHLVLVHKHLSKIPQLLAHLETRNFLLCDSLHVIKEVSTIASQLPEPFPQHIKSMIDRFLNENSGYRTLCMVDSCANGSSTELPSTVTVDMCPNFKYCPVASYDNERPYSEFRVISDQLGDGCTMEHLEHHLIVYSYDNYSTET